MTAVRAEEAIRAGRIVAIVRLPRLSAEAATALTETLVGAGITAVEFTLTTQNALEAISAARTAAGDRAVVGVGTVLSVPEVEEAAEAGAQFIVSPDVNADVIKATARRQMLSLPGAFTATRSAAPSTPARPWSSSSRQDRAGWSTSRPFAGRCRTWPSSPPAGSTWSR